MNREAREKGARHAPPDVTRVRDAQREGLFPLLRGYAAEIGESALPLEGEARLAEAIAADSIRFFVARRGSEPCGICSLVVAWTTFGGGGPYGIFEDFFVSPDHRGTGIARALVERVFAEADAAGCASVVVGCAEDDVPLYRSLGFSAHLGTMLARIAPRRTSPPNSGRA